MNFRNYIQLAQNMGIRYILYRVSYEIKRCIGYFQRIHPMNPVSQQFISLEEWRKQDFHFTDLSRLKNRVFRSENLVEKVERILNGEVQFFSHEWMQIGLNYDWITNPDKGFKYDINKHWSQIQDYSSESGDIKYVWEKSRFTYILTIIRYDFHFNVDQSEFVFSEIESWIDANPINQGPNWRCSQETSLRIFNWCYALSYYRDSKALTEKRWNKIQNVIYWSLHHVYHHINFSRIAVRNNHALTETLFLALSNILFPFIPETKRWASSGRGWFEKEIDYQIYNDGSFLQFSMNYHRVVIQLLSLAIAVSEKNGQRFTDNVYAKAWKSLNFLYQCTMDENGYLPNYGSNDGAWFFPWTDTDYRDYRPQLNSLHYLLTGKDLYSDTLSMEDRAWCVDYEPENKLITLEKISGRPLSFDIGGYFTYRNDHFFTFIRCGNHKDRPAQADNLHIDIWCGGENILWDSGTYKYNTNPELLNYFMGTAGHNTVMVGNANQMQKGSRFIWYYWTQKYNANWVEEDEECILFTGEISAFSFINSRISHKRSIRIFKEKPYWEVTDQLSNVQGCECHQLWHAVPDLKISSKGHSPEEVPAFRSDYYGEKESASMLDFKFKHKIVTTINYSK